MITFLVSLLLTVTFVMFVMPIMFCSDLSSILHSDLLHYIFSIQYTVSSEIVEIKDGLLKSEYIYFVHFLPSSPTPEYACPAT